MHTKKLTNPPICPTCGVVLDGVTDPNGNATPVPGDITICVYCMTVCEFTNKMQLRAYTQDDYTKLQPEEAGELNRILAAITCTRAKKKWTKNDTMH